MNLEEIHQKILYPVVRCRTEKAGGSGTIIYSSPDSENPDEYQTFVLTNAHVVDSAISTKKDWDSLLKKNIEKEILAPVSIDIFSYVYLSTGVSSNTHKAIIVAYDKSQDIAVLKLDSPQKYDYVASLIPKSKISNIRLFTSVWEVGASLLHEPFANPGYITFLKEFSDNKLFFMSNCCSIFGNSGGAIFLSETGEFVGIPAKVSAIQIGFGRDIISWMSFLIPSQRIYEFFDEQYLFWLYNPKYTFKECMNLRAEKERKNKLEALIGKSEEKVEEIKN